MLYSPKQRAFYLDNVHYMNIPTDIIEISNGQHSDYLEALNNDSKDIILIDGEIQIVDKYTPKELEAKRIERDKQLLVSQAKALLAASDYRVLPDRFAEFTTDQQTELVAYRAQLRLVARGESTELPTISF